MMLIVSTFVLNSFQGQGYGKPSVYHATIIIFLEYFAWGLLTGPMLNVSLLNFLLKYVLYVQYAPHSLWV